MKRFLAILWAILLAFALISCADTGDGNPDGSSESGGENNGSSESGGENNGGSDSDTDGGRKYKVTLIVPEGVTVKGDNPVQVGRGGTAVFTLELPETVAFKSVSAGSFDPTTGTLTLENVTRDTRITFEAEDVGTSVKYVYSFNGTELDQTSVPSGELLAGTAITVTAADDKRAFEGWSVGGLIGLGGELVSLDRVFSFELTEELTINGKCYLLPNYADSNTMYYMLNGGKLNISSENMSYKEHYTALPNGDSVKVILGGEYFEIMGCASTFWDDGTFYRPGYALKEYNTKPDGSGTGYSLGSKFPMEGGATLWCIWEEETPASDFDYVDVNIPRPSGVTASLAPHWVEDGVMITSYRGNADTVVIPEMIDGKYVIAVGKGAFLDCDMKTLIMGRRVLKIEDGAFKRCENLTTFHYPDGIYYISNSAFDEATYYGFVNLYVNATISPRYSSVEGGCFAKKLARVLASGDENRVIVISGSSSYCGLSTEYLESLLEESYTVVNFGTTRTTQIYMYLEAMGAYAHEGDIILYAPENSIYEMGEPRLYWKTLRDLEGMYNVFRQVDISNYENVFSAFAAFNGGSAEGEDYEPLKNGRYKRSPDRYENAIKSKSFNSTGEYNVSAMDGYCSSDIYMPYYEITLNERFRSILEGSFINNDTENEDPYTSPKWCSSLEEKYLRNMNAAIDSAKSSGASVYYTFAPMDADAMSDAVKADPYAHFTAYESFISENYRFDGILGDAESYIYNHKYFYNNAYHPNNYGRAYRTYSMYLDLCELLGIEEPLSMREATRYGECLLEDGAMWGPITGVDYLN
ncbi:MAG: leucine-rich repeat protein [Clostridia bacterium]|nr:leucine-rich repeat protein [Clostridia bacterium]